jgi:hypothetical protein
MQSCIVQSAGEYAWTGVAYQGSMPERCSHVGVVADSHLMALWGAAAGTLLLDQASLALDSQVRAAIILKKEESVWQASVSFR